MYQLYAVVAIQRYIIIIIIIIFQPFFRKAQSEFGLNIRIGNHYCAGDKIEKNEMGGAYTSDGGGKRRV
jgi:hypothetical protein